MAGEVPYFSDWEAAWEAADWGCFCMAFHRSPGINRQSKNITLNLCYVNNSGSCIYYKRSKADYTVKIPNGPGPEDDTERKYSIIRESDRNATGGCIINTTYSGTEPYSGGTQDSFTPSNTTIGDELVTETQDFLNEKPWTPVSAGASLTIMGTSCSGAVLMSVRRYDAQYQFEVPFPYDGGSYDNYEIEWDVVMKDQTGEAISVEAKSWNGASGQKSPWYDLAMAEESFGTHDIYNVRYRAYTSPYGNKFVFMGPLFVPEDP